MLMKHSLLQKKEIVFSAADDLPSWSLEWPCQLQWTKSNQNLWDKMIMVWWSWADFSWWQLASTRSVRENPFVLLPNQGVQTIQDWHSTDRIENLIVWNGLLVLHVHVLFWRIKIVFYWVFWFSFVCFLII